MLSRKKDKFFNGITLNIEIIYIFHGYTAQRICTSFLVKIYNTINNTTLKPRSIFWKEHQVSSDVSFFKLRNVDTE